MSDRRNDSETLPAAAIRRREHDPWLLAALMTLYLALAVAYNFATPVGVSPDELGHAEYIRYVAAHHRPPVFGAAGLAYEAHQPPLYYFLAAPVWTAAGSCREPTRLPLTEWRQRPGIWVLAGRAARQGRAVRLLTTLIGAAGLAFLWELVSVLYPGDRWLRLAATALAAFLPMRLALAAAVSNDMLLEALFTASLLVMARMIRYGYTHRRAVALGAALGAALLTKTTAALLLLPALITLWLVRRSRPFDARLFVGGCLRVFGVALLLAGPWLLRNRLLYGDFLAAHAFAAYFQQTQSTPEAMMARVGLTTAGYWSKVVGPWTYSSFWGVFGPFTVWMAHPVYRALAVPSLLAPLGLLFQARRGRWTTDKPQRAIWGVLSLSFVLVLLGYVRYNQLIVEPQSRFLFPAMAPISLCLAGGWLALAPRRARAAAALSVGIGTAALAIYAVAGAILPYYR
jgi:4-amino-4-deoxy-L-arabinose transferase-like glycosyltransferase